MGYLHIDNLYKNTEILLFKECYALEKIHGSSAHLQWKDNKIIFFSGGEKHETFKKIFDEEFLTNKFKELFEGINTTIFGEVYGGKCQGMSETYGKEMKFIVFDVKVGDNWLDVPNAEDVAKKLNLEFVDYKLINANLKEIDFERDRFSSQAIINGCGNDKLREGIVLRPLIEVTKNNGDRIIVKHKRDEFLETKTKREVNPEQLKILEDAKAIAEEWVTPMRLNHVLDKLGNPIEIEKTGIVIKAMIEDVTREAKGEIKESKQAMQFIGKKTAELYKRRISKI
jgi:ubiquitin